MNVLIKNVDMITAIPEEMCIRNGSIGVRDGRIDFVERDGKEHPEFIPDKVIYGKNRLAMPGLVNAHSHCAMTLLRNYADDMALEEWLFNKIIPAEGKLLPEDVYWGTMLGITEMIKGGITCFADMYLHMEEVVRAVVDSGIRANISKGPIISGIRGNNGNTVDEEGCTEFFKIWHGAANGRIKVYVEVHSVYLYDEKSLRGAAELAARLNTGMHIHVLETAVEKATSMKMYGADSAEVCLKCGIFDVPVIAAHCVHIDDNAMDILKAKGVNAAHNPTSNLKLGSGIARVPEMLAQGINVCLGTDGASSNNNLNLFEEMHLAAIIHKGATQNPLMVDAGQAIRMATVNGAKALGFGNETGCIREGMKADLILLDTDKPHFTPVNNPMSAIVYSAQAADVDTVIIDGNIVMEGRKLTTIDEEKVKYMAREIAGKL
jgi:5-methylthioadenosine/S-adenosylhomocysteine deaminase